MLLIVMHNDQGYLKRVQQLAETQNLGNSRIVDKSSVGIRLIGGDASFVFSSGKMYDAYNKALVINVKGEERARRFLNLIENDPELEIANLQNKGFVCAVPLDDIRNLTAQV